MEPHRCSGVPFRAGLRRYGDHEMSARWRLSVHDGGGHRVYVLYRHVSADIQESEVPGYMDRVSIGLVCYTPTCSFFLLACSPEHIFSGILLLPLQLNLEK